MSMIHLPIPLLQHKPRRGHGFWWYVFKDLAAGACGLLLLAALAYVVLASTGCRSSVAPQPVATAPGSAAEPLSTPEPESKAVAELRTEAHKRGLKWSISCHGDVHDGVEYCAWAVQTDKFGGYIEDGAKPSWFNYRLPNQDAAALWLTKAIKGQPNYYPDHKPKDEERPNYCDSRIEGN